MYHHRHPSVHHTAAKKRGYNPDAKVIFEKALIRLEESPSSKYSLEKVVLARRDDLHFAAELSGLAIMKDIKFSGHLLYESWRWSR